MKNTAKQRSEETAAFGRMIRSRRKLMGMTAEQLAEKANRSTREVGDIELGKVEPRLGTALLLCNACNVDIGELKEFVPCEEQSYV